MSLSYKVFYRKKIKVIWEVKSAITSASREGTICRSWSNLASVGLEASHLAQAFIGK